MDLKIINISIFLSSNQDLPKEQEHIVNEAGRSGWLIMGTHTGVTKAPRVLALSSSKAG